MKEGREDRIRGEVRRTYADIAGSKKGCCGPDPGSGSCGCGSAPAVSASELRGYTRDELDSVPGDADMGLGCGNPQTIAGLKPGEVVLDLGCGGGLDCFLAADKVGDEGLVIGVDMTPEMIARARDNAEKGGYDNVVFRLGEIEHLPVPDDSVDVIVSNCVINLSPDKLAVYREAYRVIKPGGRLAISDMVALKPLTREMLEDKDLMCKCVAGALPPRELEGILIKAGFTDIGIDTREESREFVKDWSPGSRAEDYVVSAAIEARKPAPKCGCGCASPSE
ncbi:MAG: arsenite methyltransferase [Actinomycetota bacterium]|nr:arsenite methyltransferase [Actinomycetota bacterium]